MPAFRELLLKARQSPHDSVTCTICDGFSYMPCVVCPGHNGKCVTCRGAGKRAAGELCATCLGTGKCYLCSGAGKMFCPFCDDGEVHSRQPVPASFPPVH